MFHSQSKCFNNQGMQNRFIEIELLEYVIFALIYFDFCTLGN